MDINMQQMDDEVDIVMNEAMNEAEYDNTYNNDWSRLFIMNSFLSDPNLPHAENKIFTDVSLGSPAYILWYHLNKWRLHRDFQKVWTSNRGNYP